MSSEQGKRNQDGSGPPYSPLMMPTAYYLAETGGGGMNRQHEGSPAASPSITGLSHTSVSRQQNIMTSPEQRAIGSGAIGQPGLRMSPHPVAGAGLVNFETMCGAPGANARPSQVSTPGYYPYRHSVTSLYPFAVMAQSSVGVTAATAAAAAAVARSAGGGLEQERLGNANHSVELLRSAGPSVPSTVMEPAWGGVQYTSTPDTSVGAWPGLSVQGTRRNPPFPAAMAPLPPVSAAPTAPKSTSPSAAAVAAAAAVGGPSSASPTLPASSPAAPFLVPSVGLRGSGPGTSSSSSREQKPEAASMKISGRDAGAITQERSKSAAAQTDGEEANQARRSKIAKTDKDEAGEDGEEGRVGDDDDDDNVNCNGDFETGCLGKRRRLTAEERLQRSRERNQLHARKTRQRKKAQLQLLMKRSVELQAEQQRLRQAITDRRTASILLGMSGSDDVQGTDGNGNKSKASRDHPPALVSMSGGTPRVGMLSALDSDDTGDCSGKGTGGNRSDDLGSESTAATSCSASSSGRTSSEANSSDGAVGGSGGNAGGGDKLPKVGNPGDTERLLELSQKTRSECTPEELEQIRRERNRMHAKRTRDRKKLHLEATEGMIARLEQENRKLRHSMKAMGSSSSSSSTGGGGADPVSSSTASVSMAVPQSTVSPPLEACVPTNYPRSKPAVPQPMPSQVYPASTIPPQSPTTTPQQLQQDRSYPSDPDRFMPHQVPSQGAGSHLQQHKRHQLHGGPVEPQHAYPASQHHHLSHGAAQQLVQQPPVPHATHSQPQPHVTGFYPHGYTPGGAPRGPAGGMPSAVGSVAAGGSSGTTAGLVKSEMNPYAPNGHMSAMGFMGHSNPHLSSQQQMLAYQGSASLAPPLGKTPPHMMANAPPAGQQQQQHVYPMSEPRGYKSWDALGQAQAMQLPHFPFAHAHAHGYGHGTGGQIANFAGGWGPGVGAPGVGAGAGNAGAVNGTTMPGTMQGAAAAAATAHLMQHLSSKLAPAPVSSILGAGPVLAPGATIPMPSGGGGGETQIVDRRRDGSAGIISEAQNWGAYVTTSVPSVMSTSGLKCGRNSSANGSAPDSGVASGAKSSPSGNKSSSSAAGNGPARHLARARADQKARAEKVAAAEAAAVKAAAASGAAPPVEVKKEVPRQKNRTTSTAAAAANDADDDKSNKLDRDLSRGCQAAWEHLRRERCVRRKHTFPGVFVAATAAVEAGREGGGSGTDRRSQSESAGSKLAASSPSMDSGSESNTEDGSSGGEGSVGEGSVASSSSCSSWGESEESSLLPGSTGSSEEGQRRYSGSGSDDGMSRGSFSESGSDEVCRAEGVGEREKKRKRGRTTSGKLARRCV